MAFADWREPARLLAASYGPPTAAQFALAAQAGIAFPDDTPHDVAAALLLDALSPSLTIMAPGPPSPGQLEYLEDLGHEWRGSPWRPTRRVASGLIAMLVNRRHAEALAALRPARGDLVGVPQPEPFGEAEEIVSLLGEHHSRRLPPSLVVSSISATGRVNFRGGSGLAAWPGDVTMLARAADVWTDSTHGYTQPTLFEP